MVRILVVLLVAALIPGSVQAQDEPERTTGFLPGGSSAFARLVADPRQPALGIGVIVTDLLADSFARRPGQGLPGQERLRRDAQGVVRLGAEVLLYATARGAVHLDVAAQGGVVTRFRLEPSDKDMLAADYLGALAVSLRSGAWSLRLRPYHTSGHLGDELIENSNVQRVEFEQDAIQLLVGRDIGPARAYGGVARTLATVRPTEDTWTWQAGLDGGGDIRRSTRWLGGIDWEHSAISGWQHRLGAVGGIEVRPARRALLVLLRVATGATPLGEFFPDRERLAGIEVWLEL